MIFSKGTVEKYTFRFQSEDVVKLDNYEVCLDGGYAIIVDLLKKQEFYETEKLKQFAERLKEKLQCVLDGHPEEKGTSSFYAISEYDIDETLKEFI